MENKIWLNFEPPKRFDKFLEDKDNGFLKKLKLVNDLQE